MVNKGITRIVFLVGDYAIKVPNITYDWRHFLQGLLANMQENTTWIYNKNNLLCPVIWCSWGGWILIMERADTSRHMEEIRKSPSVSDAESEITERYKKWIEAGFGGDDKCENYGYLNNRLVKIDYGQ